MHKQLIQFVKAQCEEDATGHDWDHVERVYNMAIHLARLEHADPNQVGIGALLHDLWDHKLGYSLEDQRLGILDTLNRYMNSLSAKEKEDIVEIIESVSFKGGNNPITARSIEAQVLQDADRLDALGAIGIARTFAYGGAKGRTLATSIAHFHEKLLKLEALMHTASAREIAKERHAFLHIFLTQYEAESKHSL